jgi:hypothetical protein
MQREAARPIKITPRLPHPALPGADWADCYQLRVNDRNLTALEASRLMFGHFPPWVRMLMTVRNAVVAPFGVKSSAAHSAEEMEMIGIFPVVSMSARQAVLGFDDRHLDFRAVIEVSDDDGQTLVSAITLVKRNILFGKLYIAAITPFHNLVVASSLRNLNRTPAAFSRPPSP